MGSLGRFYGILEEILRVLQYGGKRKCLLFLGNEVLVDLETFWANPLAFKSIDLRDLLDGFAGRMRIVLR